MARSQLTSGDYAMRPAEESLRTFHHLSDLDGERRDSGGVGILPYIGSTGGHSRARHYQLCADEGRISSASHSET